MDTSSSVGWKKLLEGYPWYQGEGKFPLLAYSEFMPPPRFGKRPYGEIDHNLFSDDDPYGWRITELEERFELQPGMQGLASQFLTHLIQLGQGTRPTFVYGHQGRNIEGNPYWTPELQDAAEHGALAHEHYVIFPPLALSRTQDDQGHIRWTFFGSSEQGPERAFWRSFYTAPDHEQPESDSIAFVANILSKAYHISASHKNDLLSHGFRILPSPPYEKFPYWNDAPLPAWTKPFILDPNADFDNVRHLLTFVPFAQLPDAVKKNYTSGKLHLLPFPGSLVFWGMPNYLAHQESFPFSVQPSLLRLANRSAAPGGFRVPQSGWLNEPRRDGKESEIQEELLFNTFYRTNRWNRVHRFQDPVAHSERCDKVTLVLFSATLDAMGLYDKPLARNSQIWTEDKELLLDGPNATREDIDRVAKIVLEGGNFRYRFQYPPMRVGTYEVYWQRPLVAYATPKGEPRLLEEALTGYFTAYQNNDIAHPVELYPRIQHRKVYEFAVRVFDEKHDLFQHQTALNVLMLLDANEQKASRPLSPGFARELIHLARHETLDQWLESLHQKAVEEAPVHEIREELEKIIISAQEPHTPPLTYDATATRAYEEAWWQDVLELSHGRFVNKDNADVIQDKITESLVAHQERDLEALGDYLIQRYRAAIKDAGMEGKAFCGSLPFKWESDFDFTAFGGWLCSQRGRACERDILVVIPGKNRGEAVVMGDHYDTAYMEDIFDKSSGGSGARLSAAGADDNHSATATLLQAAPIFLNLAKEGKLERDIWLLHLTGEEFPADCMGARRFCQELVQGTLSLELDDDHKMDLSKTRVVGVYVLDMVAHNRDDARDIFQISPGRGPQSLELARHAHVANTQWNAGALKWNETPERRNRASGKRTTDGKTIPEIARHPILSGEVRTPLNLTSSLYNTDGIIFSDVGVPVVLFMENYDINRKGYHDTHDTMENIDLDYGAALTAIAIETVARVAAAPNL